MSIETAVLPFGAQDLHVETGRLAKQAHGAVLATVGGSMALVTVTHSDSPKEGFDFFPLMVDYREKFYASGRIPGNFFRRESRPGDAETLKARIIDRCIRPLFPYGMRHEVMVYVTIISADNENETYAAALNAASLALQISDIPFPVPMAGVRVGMINGEMVLNPTASQVPQLEIDLTVAGTRQAINMVEAGAKEVSEEKMLEALQFAHDAIVKIIDASQDFVKKAQKPKFDPNIAVLPDEVKIEGRGTCASALRRDGPRGLGKKEYGDREHAIVKEVAAKLAEEHPDLGGLIREHIEEVHSQEVRKLITKENKRVDGRGFEEIRPITCDIKVLPKAHGSALFTRGQTQGLGVVTLGTLDDAQKIDDLVGFSERRFMLHYNFPPWSVGEAKPMRGTGRREIGHGALAERALQCVLPSKEEFPYTIRVVSEILESNGSSSMATVCSGSLALMDAGVPIKKPVAGIAMGLVEYENDIAVLTDIQGVEDHLGDMDFKVTGTRDGLTALQMDIKIEHVTVEVLSRALTQARKARLHILEIMDATISETRSELSENAPRLTTLHIPIDKIGALIGPGGKVIRGICERTGVKIDVQDDGTVFVASTDGEKAQLAIDEIRGITATPEMGATYNGKVVRVTDFGAFIEILPNQDGMVHISELDLGRVDRVEDVCNVGDYAQGQGRQHRRRRPRAAVAQGGADR
jgi:polyribonucleotide nucleotidyltransferase